MPLLPPRPGRKFDAETLSSRMELRSQLAGAAHKQAQLGGLAMIRGRLGHPLQVARGLEAEGLVGGDGEHDAEAPEGLDAGQHVAALQPAVDFARNTNALGDVGLREVEALAGEAGCPSEPGCEGLFHVR